MAAISIAKRISDERGENLGQTVGYHVGMDSRHGLSTKVLFMTTGIFLQRLVNNPDQLNKLTHIILDEVHERDLDIDFCLVVLKHLLNKDYKFKLVLMSATFNVELFQNYFSLESIKSVEDMEVYVGAAQ
jgi:ATP-dependent RNA helicase DHX36